MYEITKDFAFSAAHVLHGLRPNHPCGRTHGHNYTVRVALSAHDLNTVGFVVDYGDLKPFGLWLDTNLDHQLLNKVLPMQPSAENMAQYLHAVLHDVVPVPDGVTVAVAVSETPKTWAWYRP